jgi:hypothetical protein
MSKVVELVWMMHHAIVVDTLDDEKAEDFAVATMEKVFDMLRENDPAGAQYVADSLRVMDIHDTQ